jgi:hypothetical protein
MTLQERLRGDRGAGQVHWDDCREAADEIDRLRAALENIILRFESCLQYAGSSEEYVKLATSDARAALSAGTASRAEKAL